MDPDLGVMTFGAEKTRLGETSDVAVTWRRRGQGLGAVDLGVELLPYRS